MKEEKRVQTFWNSHSGHSERSVLENRGEKTIYCIKTGVIKYISTRLLCFEFDFMGRAHFQALLK